MSPNSAYILLTLLLGISIAYAWVLVTYVKLGG